MLRTAPLLLALALTSACSGEARDAETASVRACHAAVEERTQTSRDAATPAWRTTSRDEGDGFVVDVWTRTPAEAARPTGAPDHVCLTERDDDTAAGVRLVRLGPPGVAGRRQ